MRSRTPPWPGSRRPLSFTPAWRFSSDSTEIALDRERRERQRAADPGTATAIGETAPAIAGACRERNERERVDGDRREPAVDAFPRLAGADRAARACAGRTRARRNTPPCPRSRRWPSRRARATASAPAAARSRPMRRSARSSRRPPAQAATPAASGTRATAARRASQNARRAAAHRRARRRAASRERRIRRQERRASRCADRERRRRRTARRVASSQPARCAHSAAAIAINDERRRRPSPAGGSRNSAASTSGIRTSAVGDARRRASRRCQDTAGRRSRRHTPCAACTCSLVRPKRRSRCRYHVDRGVERRRRRSRATACR